MVGLEVGLEAGLPVLRAIILKIMNGSSKRPFFCTRHQFSTHRILRNVIPFLCIIAKRSYVAVEIVGLPKSSARP